MYKIKYNYQTGDSFSNSDCEDVLEFEWKDLDIAKECLKRIKEHYEWYTSIEGYQKNKVAKPKWHNVTGGDTLSGEHHLINIPMDNGNEVQFWAPWCGYFETLYGAEIIPYISDMKFDLR